MIDQWEQAGLQRDLLDAFGAGLVKNAPFESTIIDEDLPICPSGNHPKRGGSDLDVESGIAKHESHRKRNVTPDG
ncbi:hypothetical protein RISK_003815 [Rhodopirellula islandica]|uniref:Uncharacterized protein n=1 Tax=Rhodopirellula islandica TaxID=595434 RepID=A0A0J1EFD9_RHOIS|nr:hypothetical protein RISK_003815 [Rhodopirellula islandica]